MPNYKLTLFRPEDVYERPEGAIRNWDDFPVRFLAQGDSWFSIGAMPPWLTSNILQKIVLGFSASAVNCAYPGRELRHMSDWRQDMNFSKLVTGRLAEKWHGILLSGGGNDLISAVGVLPCYADGRPIPPDLRLLLKSTEWGPVSAGAARYVSDAGWTTFCQYLSVQFRHLIETRDSGINKDIPLFCHTYDYPTPRNAPAWHHPDIGPWLYPAFVVYQIPEGDRLGVTKVLINRLKFLLQKIIAELDAAGHPHIHLIDTTGILTPAAADNTEATVDWANEIHPTSDGYHKLAARWRKTIDARFSTLL